MHQGFLFCVLSCIFMGTNALVGSVCEKEEECDEGECCQIMSEFMVVSKRALGQPAPAPNKTGTCELYRLEGASCSTIEKINGYCGCGPELHCTSYEVPRPTPPPEDIESTTSQTTDGVGRRDEMMARPGYMWIHKCAKA